MSIVLIEDINAYKKTILIISIEMLLESKIHQRYSFVNSTVIKNILIQIIKFPECFNSLYITRN